MKKHIFSFTALILLAACSTKKDAFVNRTYQSFTAYYNTLFHGKEALNAEIKAKKKSHKDNFYDGYIEIFTQNAITVADEDASAMAAQFFGGNNGLPQQPTVSSLKKAEDKALKVIEKKSMVFNGVEKNSEVFNAYILLAEARIYQGKWFEALDALNSIYLTMSKDKRLPLAKIYEGMIYTKMKNYLRAEDIFLALDGDPQLKKEYRKLLSVYYAENLLYSNRKEEAIQQLDLAMTLNKSREIRSRIAYQRGQILAELGRREEARESFAQAYKYSNDFEFEVKSQIQIAKTFGIGDDYEEAKKYLEKISKKGVYTSRKNEFYYALGLMANQAGNKEDALNFFQKSIKEKVSDNNIRGLAYFEIGKSFFEKADYISAGAYYDSALVAMEHEASKQKIQELSSNIKNFSKNYYLVKKNDSILALTQMNDEQRTAYFQKHIEELKKAEEKQKLAEAEKAKKAKNVTSNDIDFPTFVDNFNTQKSNKFYFANQETVAKGSLEFKKLWGDRALGDNWRYSENTSISIDKAKNQALGREIAADSRRFEVAYYTEKIPTDPQSILNLKKERDTASLGLGRMYEAYFQNTPLATKTLYDLIAQKPEEEVKLQALHLIFSMNFEKNPAIAERAKTMILEEFPYTPLAAFVQNPRKANPTQANEEVKKLYQKAYELYSGEKFGEAQQMIKTALEQYPQDALAPKFELLNAFVTGKTAGKDVMLLQLQQIVFNYEKTAEGKKAKEIISRLTDEKPQNLKNSSAPVALPIDTTEAIVEEKTISSPPVKDNPPKKVEKKPNTDKLERPVYSWEADYLKPAED